MAAPYILLALVVILATICADVLCPVIISSFHWFMSTLSWNNIKSISQITTQQSLEKYFDQRANSSYNTRSSRTLSVLYQDNSYTKFKGNREKFGKKFWTAIIHFMMFYVQWLFHLPLVILKSKCQMRNQTANKYRGTNRINWYFLAHNEKRTKRIMFSRSRVKVNKFNILPLDIFCNRRTAVVKVYHNAVFHSAKCLDYK